MASRSGPTAPIDALVVRSSRPGRIDLLVVAADGAVWRKRCENEAWSGWEPWRPSVDDPVPASAEPVAVVAHDDGTRDEFAIWEGTAIARRRFDRGWSQWELLELLAAPATGPQRLLRPRDFLSLVLRSGGLVERPSGSGAPEWIAEGAGGQLIVDFPPQHIAETLLTTTVSSAARLAGPSTLRFAVTSERVALSTEGVLRALSRLKIDRASTLELPWRLLLALEEKARCAHRERPASDTGVAEMWHTRLLGEKNAYAAIRPFASLPLELPFANGTPLKDGVTEIAQQGASHPDHFPTERLILSTGGAWLSAAAVWPDLQWTHKTAMGRDYYVRIIQPGFLFPFGHRAALVATCERHFDTAAPAVAGLRETLTLVITQPAREYGISAPHERAFPFQRIEIAPRVIEPIDEPPEDDSAFWPTRATQPVIFSIRGVSGTEVVEMELPLLFSDGTNLEGLDALYARGPRGGGAAARPTAQVGRFMPLAMKSADEALPGASQQVRTLTFGGTPIAGGPGFHPGITHLEVELPAVNQLVRSVGALQATLSRELLNAPPGSAPEMLLDIPALKLNFGSAKTGVVAAPNVTVDRISRTVGPTLAQLPPRPADMFGPDAKLLGVIPLSALIAQLTDDSRPAITWSGGTNPTATMTWKQALTRGTAQFKPEVGCQVDLTVKSGVSPTGAPFVTTHGVVSNFTLRIPNEQALVSLGFKTVTFDVETGGLPSTRFEIASAALGEKLAFIQALSKYLPNVGGTGLKIDVTATEILASYIIAIPTPIGLGAFTLQNLQLRAGVRLSLVNTPITVDFAFGSRASPFLVTVSGFGGGGYIELGISAGGSDDGLQRFVGGIEFGASVAMSFGVASGEVHVFGGVVFAKVRSDVEITGYLRIGGMVRVLGLVSVSVELTVSLTYRPNELHGEAKLVIAVDLTFWSTSVEIKCEKTFKGSDLPLATSAVALAPAPGSSVADALGPVGESFPWQTYCHAFAGE